MSLELIAVDGLTLDHSAGSLISDGTFTITSTPDGNSKAKTGIFTTPLTFTFAGGSAVGFVDGSVLTTAPVSMPATSKKCKASNALVMRVDDSVLMNCVGTFDPPASPPTGAVVGNVEITDAGQDKVKGE